MVPSCFWSLVVEIRWSTLVATLATDFEENCKESLVRVSSGAAYQKLHWDHQKGRKHFTIFAWGDQDEMSKFRNSGLNLCYCDMRNIPAQCLPRNLKSLLLDHSIVPLGWFEGLQCETFFPNLLQLNPTYCTRVENSDLCSITKLKKLKFQLLLLSWWRRHWTYRPKS